MKLPPNWRWMNVHHQREWLRRYAEEKQQLENHLRGRTSVGGLPMPIKNRRNLRAEVRDLRRMKARWEEKETNEALSEGNDKEEL